MKPVTVVGSINIDLTSYLDRWPKIGETVAVRQTSISLGGKGANQAVAATRLGSKTYLIGAIGKDGFGQDAVRQLHDFGVDAWLVELTGTATGMAFIDVGPDGANMIRLSSGANGLFQPDHVLSHSGVIQSSSVVLLQNEVDLSASLAAAKAARQAGALVVMDPAPAPEPDWGREVFSSFDLLTPNAHEAGRIVGQEPKTLNEAREASMQLRELGLRGAIVTMGELGVAWSFDSGEGVLPAPCVDAIDTVAAGDCFNGALATKLAQGEAFHNAVAFAIRAASMATTRKGAASSLPLLEELEQVLTSVET